MAIKLPKATSKYGAQMGRRNELGDPDAAVTLVLEKLRMYDGDYDSGGAYWGGTPGTAIYCAWGEDEDMQIRVFVRASSRKEAAALVKEDLPNAIILEK